MFHLMALHLYNRYCSIMSFRIESNVVSLSDACTFPSMSGHSRRWLISSLSIWCGPIVGVIQPSILHLFVSIDFVVSSERDGHVLAFAVDVFVLCVILACYHRLAITWLFHAVCIFVRTDRRAWSAQVIQRLKNWCKTLIIYIVASDVAKFRAAEVEA